MTRAGEVVTLGEVMGLVLARQLPLATASSADLGCAGAEATVAVGLARLGHGASFVGRVGADAFGDRIARTLRAEGVDVGALIRDPERPTGILLRDSVRDRPIEVQYFRTGSAGSALQPSDLPVDALAAASVLHVTALTAVLSASARATVERACALARDAGSAVVLDPNVRRRMASPEAWRDVVSDLARDVDAVLVGEDDAAVLCDDEPVEWFRARGARRVVVKRGAGAATEHGPEGTVTVAARRTRAVDPVGAGDAFAAGWISAWLRGMDAQRRLEEAHVVAACNVRYRGDIDGLPTAAVRDRLLATDSPDVMR